MAKFMNYSKQKDGSVERVIKGTSDPREKPTLTRAPKRGDIWQQKIVQKSEVHATIPQSPRRDSAETGFQDMSKK